METTNNPGGHHVRDDDYPTRESDFTLEQLDGELLLYHPTETTILYLNQTASMIWGLCDGSRNVRRIIQLLIEAYPDGAEAIPSEVTSTLEKFLEAGSIRLENEPKD